MKVYILRRDDIRDGFNLYTRESLAKKLNPRDRNNRIFKLQLTDIDNKTYCPDSYIFYEGENVADALDHIERSNDWGVWTITVETSRPKQEFDIIDEMFGFPAQSTETYIISTQNIL